jgi:YVTN family beta-propeller protein
MRSSSISVRGLAAIVAVCALACLGAASAGAAQLAVIGNEGSHSVSVVNTATNQVVGDPVEVGSEPASIAITPDGRYAYVADFGDESVSVIETATRKPLGKPIEVGQGPFGLAITPDGSRAFVTDRLEHEVSVIDTATRQVVGEIELPLGSSPAGVAVSPGGKFAYVTESGLNAVEVIDTESMEALGEPIEVGERPIGIEFTPDGETAYVVDQKDAAVSAIDTATGKVTEIPLAGEEPRGIVVAPDGRQAFVVNLLSDSVSIIDTETNKETDDVEVGEHPQEVAISANGQTAYVTETGEPRIQRIDVASGKVVGSPIPVPGEFPAGVALTPDQSPTAAFAVPNVFAGTPVTFSGAASSDPDGTISSYFWTFGDGGTGSGVSPSHTYRGPGTYNAKLTVEDSEGCGAEEVFTGRTAFCSGGASSVTHPVTVKAPTVVPPIATTPSNRFHLGRLIHNRQNGTVRLQAKLPSAGYVFLFGKKVHAVTRKSKGVQSMWLTIHARVELNKRLKKIHRAPVKIRVTFTPNGGVPKTLHRTVVLLRAHKTHSRN